MGKCAIIYIDMDFEERKQFRRRQMIKVFLAEAGMVISVLAIVVVATLASMGFFVTSHGTIEQNGLVQIHSMPTGATTEVDGSVLFARTNLSRSLSAGEHHIRLSREGYDDWEKDIRMSSGMLLRLYYPRLFLLNRQPEVTMQLGKSLEFYQPSLDRAYIIYAGEDSAKWTLLDIRDHSPRSSVLDLSGILPGVVEGKFLGKVELLEWNANSDSILTKTSYSDKSEWILINLRDTKRSLNLTKTFGLELTQIEMIDDSATTLFALEKQHLRRINVSDQAISRVLLENVLQFANYRSNLIYIMEVPSQGEQAARRVLGSYREGEAGGVTLREIPEGAKATIALSRYYDEDYIAYTIDNNLAVYYGALPNFRKDTPQIDFSILNTLISSNKLQFAPDSLSLSPEGEFFVATSGNKYLVVDLEMGDSTEYETIAQANATWLDDSMLTVIDQDTLKAWDFDYTNQRELVKYIPAGAKAELSAVTSKSSAPLAKYPAVIAENNKYLYYVVSTESGLNLIREQIRD